MKIIALLPPKVRKSIDILQCRAYPGIEALRRLR